MATREIFLLGNPQLYEPSEKVDKKELLFLAGVKKDLHDTLLDFRSRYGVGRAIAAPQIGVRKRMVYMHVGEPTVFFNPVLDELSKEMFEVWDDCMCFPQILVRVRRHVRCRIRFRNEKWEECGLRLEGSLSELLQHECDHLDGILATQRAIDDRSFALRGQVEDDPRRVRQ